MLRVNVGRRRSGVAGVPRVDLTGLLNLSGLWRRALGPRGTEKRLYRAFRRMLRVNVGRRRQEAAVFSDLR